MAMCSKVGDVVHPLGPEWLAATGYPCWEFSDMSRQTQRKHYNIIENRSGVSGGIYGGISDFHDKFLAQGNLEEAHLVELYENVLTQIAVCSTCAHGFESIWDSLNYWIAENSC